MGDKHLIVKKNNRAGLLTLNRSGALNAISYEMFGQLSEALEDWQDDPQIYGVVLDSAGGKAFCAGGDIREVHKRGQEDPKLAAAFLRREYEYNWQLDRFTKPHISLMNGLVLGGGVGISLYGTHRVAGQNFSLAMPETAIGFIPDIGASWFLGHLPYSTGLYLALTGLSINRADAYKLGLVTHCIDEKHFSEIKCAISEGLPVDTLLDDLHMAPGKGNFPKLASWIEAVFSASTVDEIFERAKALGDKNDGWSLSVLDQLREKSPTSLHLAFKLWKKGRKMNLQAALQMEYGVVCNLLRQEDFYEGIRAMVLDKDKSAQWQPDSISDVSITRLEALFENNWGELHLPKGKHVGD
ncbi:MAG: enoyl-CoA hydratase/isomerase family protein [bacterium]|nr:enoyl-CoA hydratase/isomerase family protein [bacterium]